MKSIIGWTMSFVLVAGVLQAAPNPPVQIPVQTPAQQAAQAEAAKVLAISDNDAAADALVKAIRAMLADPTGQAVKDGVPELTFAALVKTDIKRAMQILPRAFSKLAAFLPLISFERLVSATLLAAGDAAATLTQAIMTGLSGNPRFLDAVTSVAKDTAAPMPAGLRTAIQSISATVLPPAVIPPGPYDGQ